MLKLHTTGFNYIADEPSKIHTIPHKFNSKPSAVSLYVGRELVISEVLCDDDMVTVTTTEDVILEVICSFPVDIENTLTFDEFIASDLVRYTPAVQQTIDMGIDIRPEILKHQQQEYKRYIEMSPAARRLYYVHADNAHADNAPEFMAAFKEAMAEELLEEATA